MSTDKRLVAAATALLDEGGDAAVTLRAVAQASGVSHNAPYKHFENREALLAAVALQDFLSLQRSFASARTSSVSPDKKLIKVLRLMIAFHDEHPARYELLFNSPNTAKATGSIKEAAVGTFSEIVQIVNECQAAGSLPDAAGPTVASLLFATMHGLISIEAVGGMHPEKGLHSTESSMRAMLELISPKRHLR